jgi:uncharacterized protein (TIGR02186 family)
MHIHSFAMHAARFFGSARFICVALALFVVSLYQMLAAAPASAMLTTDANHDHISINFFYHGSTVSVKGTSDSDVDLIVKMTSPEGHQVLKQKGRVGGVLWMNVGQLKFDKTPNFYMVYSTKKLDDILSKEEREKYLIGYPALAKHIEVSPVKNEDEKAKWFEEFVKFKESSNVYRSLSGKIALTPAADGKQKYSITAGWPYQAAPGEYLVSVYAVKHGKVVEQAESKVRVEQVGLVKTLASMAKDNAAVYGILSIGIALGAGFGVGLVFRKGGGAH